MLNRRHLRIKVLQILYAYYQTEDKDPLHVEKEVYQSIEKMYVMYIYFLLIFEELVISGEKKIEDQLKKVQPSQSDLSPDRKFVSNQVFKHFQINIPLRKHSEKLKTNWAGSAKNELMRKLFKQIKDSDLYIDYMKKETSFEEDKKFALAIFKTEIANFELLHDFFENESIYWMDDIDLVCSMVLKTIKNVTEKSTEKAEILPLYKDEKDEKEFIDVLVRKTMSNEEQNMQTIDDLTQNWDLDRIAKMDIVLLKMALTELTELASIPKKVTLNEYIEISKYYSTPKSQVFINGILDKAVERLDKEGKLIKTGRGLIN
jgi:transcription antitermination protein NusB